MICPVQCDTEISIERCRQNQALGICQKECLGDAENTEAWDKISQVWEVGND